MTRRAVTIAVQGPVWRGSLPGLFAVVIRTSYRYMPVVTLRLDQGHRPDLETVDHLTRLLLLLQRMGAELLVESDDCDLEQLIELVGLDGTLRSDRLVLEDDRQAEALE